MTLNITYQVKENMHEAIIKSMQKYCDNAKLGMHIKKEDVIKKIFKQDRIDVEIEFFGEENQIKEFDKWFHKLLLIVN